MATVLIVMGGIGAFLGWQIRNGNGEEQYAFTLGKTAREQHPLIMGLAFLFFLTGGQGGLVLTAVAGKEIMQSPHFYSAAAGMSLLALQATLPFFFSSKQGLRTVHAYLGSATMLVLFVHMYNGINLGLSL